MEKMEYTEFYSVTPAAAGETQLANRLDTSQDCLRGTKADPKRVTGLEFNMVTDGAGYIVLRKNGITVATLDGYAVEALIGLLPLDIELDSGDELTVFWNDVASTAANVAVLLQYVPK